MAPVVIVSVPATVVRLTALVALLVEVRLSIVPLTVPLLRRSAWPVPDMVTLLIVRVPNAAPLILAPVVFPMVKPVTVVPLARIIELVAAAVVVIVVNTTGAKINGAAFGTLTISKVTMSGTGQALLLNNGTVNGTIDSLTSTSSATSAVSLTTVAGTLTITTGAISGATGDDFFVSAGTATISYGGAVPRNHRHPL